MTELKKSKLDKSQKLKLWRKKTRKKSECDRTQNVTELNNLKCDKNQKHKMWQNTKNQNVIKIIFVYFQKEISL